MVERRKLLALTADGMLFGLGDIRLVRRCFEPVMRFQLLRSGCGSRWCGER